MAGENPTGPENIHVVTMNPGRPYVREVLCLLRSYVGSSYVVEGLMSGGLML